MIKLNKLKQYSQFGKNILLSGQKQYQFSFQQAISDDNIMFFNVQTTGLPANNVYPKHTQFYDDSRVVQFGWLLWSNQYQRTLHRCETIINPQEEFEIPEEFSKMHGINDDIANEYGVPLEDVSDQFRQHLEFADIIICYNQQFHFKVLQSELYRNPANHSLIEELDSKIQKCVMLMGQNHNVRGKYKLHELYQKLFNKKVKQYCSSLEKIEQVKDCYFELERRKKTQNKLNEKFSDLNYQLNSIKNKYIFCNLTESSMLLEYQNFSEQVVKFGRVLNQEFEDLDKQNYQLYDKYGFQQETQSDSENDSDSDSDSSDKTDMEEDNIDKSKQKKQHKFYFF